MAFRKLIRKCLRAGPKPHCYDCGGQIEIERIKPCLKRKVVPTDLLSENFCVRCFHKRAAKKGIVLQWKPMTLKDIEKELNEGKTRVVHSRIVNEDDE